MSGDPPEGQRNPRATVLCARLVTDAPHHERLRDRWSRGTPCAGCPHGEVAPDAASYGSAWWCVGKESGWTGVVAPDDYFAIRGRFE